LSRKPLNEKVPSKGKQQRQLIDHPLYKLLSEERIRRDKRISEIDPIGYLGPLHNLTLNELKEYLIWKAEKHESVDEWRKDKRRVLPVIKNEKENSPSNGGLYKSGEGILPPGHNPEDSLQTNLNSKIQIQGEKKAYGPRRKDQKS
jgi:hypothetical protein